MNSPRVTKLANRQDMYKSPSSAAGCHHKKNAQTTYDSDSNNNESPAWRKVYKKRCFDEFKKSRQKLVNRFRCLDVNSKENRTTKDYLEQELEKICRLEAVTRPDLKITADEASELIRQIQLEMIPVEYGGLSDEQLSEIFDAEEADEIMQREAIRQNDEGGVNVVCPVCQKASLIQREGVIGCPAQNGCLFKVEKSQLDLTLGELAKLLDKAMSCHECTNVPSFEFKAGIVANSAEAMLLKQMTGSSRNCFLLMSCDKCQHMQYIF